MTELTSFLKKLAEVAEQELGALEPLQHAITLVSHAIPLRLGNEVRASMLRARGIEVGKGTLVYGPPEFPGAETHHSRMSIGCECVIDVGCLFELGESIEIGNRVTIGKNAMIITTTHELGPKEHRAGALERKPVRVHDGVWIGPRAIILPGVIVGAGAIVDAGSVVNKAVAPNTRVRGTPAKVVEELGP
ncbi:MAG TPA: acyltransferase [Polyangiaceae bacterium]|nr:acyltransferase [Polyangiaceae bacterium]